MLAFVFQYLKKNYRKPTNLYVKIPQSYILYYNIVLNINLHWTNTTDKQTKQILNCNGFVN